MPCSTRQAQRVRLLNPKLMDCQTQLSSGLHPDPAEHANQKMEHHTTISSSLCPRLASTLLALDKGLKQAVPGPLQPGQLAAGALQLRACAGAAGRQPAEGGHALLRGQHRPAQAPDVLFSGDQMRKGEGRGLRLRRHGQAVTVLGQLGGELLGGAGVVSRLLRERGRRGEGGAAMVKMSTCVNGRSRRVQGKWNENAVPLDMRQGAL